PASASAAPRVVVFYAAVLIPAGDALSAARIAHDAVAVQADFAEMDRPAMGITAHPCRRIVCAAPFASAARGAGKPQFRSAGPRRTGRTAGAERQRRGTDRGGDPAWRRFHRPAPMQPAATMAR